MIWASLTLLVLRSWSHSVFKSCESITCAWR